jgi:hypothetical protein
MTWLSGTEVISQMNWWTAMSGSSRRSSPRWVSRPRWTASASCGPSGSGSSSLGSSWSPALDSAAEHLEEAVAVARTWEAPHWEAEAHAALRWPARAGRSGQVRKQ